MPKITSKIIYLDNAATTKVRKEVFESMTPWLSEKHEKYGNPSSSHELGIESREIIEKSRELISKRINADSDEIIFTSCATESNNMILKGFSNNHELFCSSIEHPSVDKAVQYLKGRKIRVDKEGFINFDEIRKIKKIQIKNRRNTLSPLFSLILANNEIGTIQDYKAVSEICQKNGIIFHSDAAQALGKVKINAENFDALTLSAHKIHGPKGIGALYLKKELHSRLRPLMHGGNQQNSLRPGTENPALIVGFAKALELMNDDYVSKVSKLRDILIERMLEIDNTVLTGPGIENRSKRLCSIVSFAFKNVDGEKLVKLLDSRGICASSGSACSEGEIGVSHVLKAIGLSEKIARGSVRLSPSIFNNKKEIDKTAEIVEQAVKSLRMVG